jgi:hypothetical protein
MSFPFHACSFTSRSPQSSPRRKEGKKYYSYNPTSTARMAGLTNFAALWQGRRDHYLSERTLAEIAKALTHFDNDRGRDQKRALYRELSLTYFARFHRYVLYWAVGDDPFN